MASFHMTEKQHTFILSLAAERRESMTDEQRTFFDSGNVARLNVRQASNLIESLLKLSRPQAPAAPAETALPDVPEGRYAARVARREFMARKASKAARRVEPEMDEEDADRLAFAEAGFFTPRS
jgi:hypothetical protein